MLIGRMATRKVAASILTIMLASSGSFVSESEGDSIVVRIRDSLVSTLSEWAGGGEGGRAGHSSRPSEPRCEPTLHTYGIFREVITDCEGAGGTELTPWFEIEEGEEGEDGEVPTVEVIRVTREDVQSLIVDRGGIIVQPDRPWVLVNTDTIVMTDAAEHVLRTQVLGLNVDVRVIPALFSWDFGDGSAPVTGTDPGAPWPDHTVSYNYRSAGDVTISLRTEWDAAFRVEGTSTWFPVVGRPVTEQTSDPIQVLTATPRLTG